MISPRLFLQADATNPIVRAFVRAVSKANKGKYRCYFVPSYGCFMYLNLSEPLTLRRLFGQYEKEKRKILNRYLQTGMTFVDIGANLGDYSLIAARLVGQTGKVIAFEPDPSNYGWLKKTIEKNGLKNVEIRQEALSDRDGQATLFLGETSGWHTLKQGQLSSEKGEVLVRTKRLDSMMLERLDIVKVDVEGAEFEVLQGAKEQIRKHKPVLFIDLHPTMGADIRGSLNTLRELDYAIYGINSRGGFRAYADHILEIVAIPQHMSHVGI
jgi:FkbM family methyltransferase